jgi:hypothetical protein
MKNIANRIVVFAVSAVALGTVAFAQSQRVAMKAEIPFAFHTSNGTMPAGRYQVIDNYAGTQGVFALRNMDTYKTVVVSGWPQDNHPSSTASVTFRCDDGCELAGIKTSIHTFNFAKHWSNRAREVAILANSVKSVDGE